MPLYVCQTPQNVKPQECTLKELSDTAAGNVNRCSHYGKQCGSSLRKLKLELPCDPETPLLGTDWNKTLIQKHTCTPVLTAALFTTAKTWKQSKRPLTDEWVKKMRYIYTTEYYLAIKKNEIMPFATTCVDLEMIMLSKVNQKDKYHMISLICEI